MKNFIFKSEADFHKIVFNKLDMVLTEQQKQRGELSVLLSQSRQVINSMNLQKQVDDYFEDDEKNIPEEKQDEKFEDKPGDIKWSSEQ